MVNCRIESYYSVPLQMQWNWNTLKIIKKTNAPLISYNGRWNIDAAAALRGTLHVLCSHGNFLVKAFTIEMPWKVPVQWFRFQPTGSYASRIFSRIKHNNQRSDDRNQPTINASLVLMRKMKVRPIMSVQNSAKFWSVKEVYLRKDRMKCSLLSSYLFCKETHWHAWYNLL